MVSDGALIFRKDRASRAALEELESFFSLQAVVHQSTGACILSTGVRCRGLEVGIRRHTARMVHASIDEPKPASRGLPRRWHISLALVFKEPQVVS